MHYGTWKIKTQCSLQQSRVAHLQGGGEEAGNIKGDPETRETSETSEHLRKADE